jgi:hypothetical protein
MYENKNLSYIDYHNYNNIFKNLKASSYTDFETHVIRNLR